MDGVPFSRVVFGCSWHDLFCKPYEVLSKGGKFSKTSSLFAGIAAAIRFRRSGRACNVMISSFVARGAEQVFMSVASRCHTVIHPNTFISYNRDRQKPPRTKFVDQGD